VYAHTRARAHAHIPYPPNYRLSEFPSWAILLHFTCSRFRIPPGEIDFPRTSIHSDRFCVVRHCNVNVYRVALSRGIKSGYVIPLNRFRCCGGTDTVKQQLISAAIASPNISCTSICRMTTWSDMTVPACFRRPTCYSSYRLFIRREIKVPDPRYIYRRTKHTKGATKA